MKNIMKKMMNSYIFFLVVYSIFLALALLRYYTGGTLILGGEGAFVLDFSSHLKKYSFMWFPTVGTGIKNLTPSGTGVNILLLWLIERLTGSASITNFVLMLSIYFFPFLAMYLVCKQIKAKPFISFTMAFFYVVNPFMLYYLICINQWNIFIATVMPLFLWIILKYFHNDFKLFFFFGIISACFSFTFANPPIFIIIHFSILVSTFIASYYQKRRPQFIEIFRKYCIVLISFIVFNLWWLAILLHGKPLATAQSLYSYSWARDWLDITVRGHGAILAKMFSLTTIIGGNDFFRFWYSTIPARLITLVPILIIVYSVLINRGKETKNVLNFIIFCILLVVLFFVKGNSAPFGFIYNFMFEYIPFFNFFKTPVEKFGLLYIFIFSILLLFTMIGMEKQKYYNYILRTFIVYLIFCSVPIITGNIIPDSLFGDYPPVSRKYKDKVEYEKLRNSLNDDKLIYRVLSLPSVGNYQVFLSNYQNRYYTGMDPVLMNIDRPFIASHHGVDVLYKNISLENYAKLLGIYNIKKIVVNEDLIPWFGSVEKESVPELKCLFSKLMQATNWGPITIYDNKDNFLPEIYTSSAGGDIRK